MTTQNSLLCTIEGKGSGREEGHEEVKLRLWEVRACTLRSYLYSDVYVHTDISHLADAWIMEEKKIR